MRRDAQSNHDQFAVGKHFQQFLGTLKNTIPNSSRCHLMSSLGASIAGAQFPWAVRLRRLVGCGSGETTKQWGIQLVISVQGKFSWLKILREPTNMVSNGYINLSNSFETYRGDPFGTGDMLAQLHNRCFLKLTLEIPMGGEKGCAS